MPRESEAREALHPPFEAYSGEEPYVFASYAHKDSFIVFPELNRLHIHGYHVWYDEGINPGKEWHDEVARALDRCSLFLVFISPSAVKSRNVRNEINFAIKKDKAFLVIYLEETVLPDSLELQIGDIQAVMKFRMTDDGYHRKIERALTSSAIQLPPEKESDRTSLNFFDLIEQEAERASRITEKAHTQEPHARESPDRDQVAKTGVAATASNKQEQEFAKPVAAEARYLHKDALRFARLLVSEIKLYNEEKVVQGRRNNDLYNRLKEDIDRSRQIYDKRVDSAITAESDYFHEKLVDILGEGNSGRLGPGYAFHPKPTIPLGQGADDDPTLRHEDLQKKARRFAGLLVSEIKLYNEAKVSEGRKNNDLYKRLKEDVDRSRQMYDKRVDPAVAAEFDYFHEKCVDILGEGHSRKLGAEYYALRPDGASQSTPNTEVVKKVEQEKLAVPGKPGPNDSIGRDTVLLADDSITIQKVVKLTFGDEGIDVVAVSNGELAIRRLSEIRPSIVLADVFMPGRTGYELCEYIKTSPMFKDIPVVLLIGAFEPFDQNEARRVQADEYLTKPFESRSLVETVKRLILVAEQKKGSIFASAPD